MALRMMVSLARFSRPYSPYRRSSKSKSRFLGLVMGGSRFGHDDVALRRVAVAGDFSQTDPAGLVQQGIEFFLLKEIEGPRFFEFRQRLGVVEERPEGVQKEGFRHPGRE